MAEGTLACEEPRASSLSNGINIAGHPYVPAGEPAPGHTLMSGKATVCVFSGLRVENTDKGPGQCHRASEEAPRPDLGSQGACPKDPGDGPSAAQRRSWRPGREGEHVRHCAPALALSLPRGHRHRGNTSLPHPPAADGKRMGSLGPRGEDAPAVPPLPSPLFPLGEPRPRPREVVHANSP